MLVLVVMNIIRADESVGGVILDELLVYKLSVRAELL